MRLTLAGLWAERIVRAFWPLWSILLLLLTALSFGMQDVLPIEAAWIGLLAAGAGGLASLAFGLRSFRRPAPADAIARLDATLPGRPLATLADRQAIGRDDPASKAVWEAHRRRMAARAAEAKAVRPDLRLSTRDPFGLRYVALTSLVIAALFGSFWRAASVTGLTGTPAEALIAGPSWEGWLQPPAYTGKPALYLNDITAETIEVPAGTRVQVRLYGEIGTLTLAETVSGRAGLDTPPASEPAHDFEITRSGQIEISGPAGGAWAITATPDNPPLIKTTGPAAREGDGRMRLPFAAEDDYGVTAGRAEITLDLAAVDRRYGLAIEPEAREALLLDLPMPMRGDRAKFEEALVDDISEHPFANLPVQVRLLAEDAPGQTGAAEPLAMVLPGKRFFDPLAAAVIEMRRDLLWNRANAPRTSDIFKAVTQAPEGFIRNQTGWLRLRVLMRELDAQKASLTPERRDEMAKELWEIALLFEEGDLSSALERLRRAQERVEEAIRNGADPAEIEELMDEMRQALDEYLQELGEQAQREEDGIDEPSQNMEGMQFSGDQLQEMMERLQQLMEEGRTAEAAELMEMMRQLMENMEVVQGEGEGQGQQGNRAMRDLGQTLRDQQGLSDDAFRDLQEGFNGQQQGRNSPGQQGEGEQGQDRRNGQQGQGDGRGSDQEAPDGRSLAERQDELRDRLRDLGRGQLPGDGTEQGEAGRRALEEAGRAMEEAEEALRNGDLPGALDRQAEAMEALREGIRNFGEALAEEQRQRDGQPGQGEEFAEADPNGQRDPLGREPGNAARIGSDRNLLQGEDVYRRAEELLDEIRRRQSDQQRPEDERSYLGRLLDLF